MTRRQLCGSACDQRPLESLEHLEHLEHLKHLEHSQMFVSEKVSRVSLMETQLGELQVRAADETVEEKVAGSWKAANRVWCAA